MLLEAPAKLDNQTAPSKIGGPLGIIFSRPAARVALLVMLTVMGLRLRLDGTDTWWDLKTGEIIWNTHSVPTVDLFSFTTNQHFCVPHEWLAQLTIYAAYHFGGYPGMMLWLFTFASLLSIAGYAFCWLWAGSSRFAFLGALGIWFFATIGFSIRAQLVGYFFLQCELLILWLGRHRNRKWFLVLPPLFVLWMNCHGSFLLGLIVFGAVLACSFLKFHVGLLVSHRWPSRHRNMLAAAFVLSIGALFINPVGLPQLTYPLDTMFHQPLQKVFVSEWPPASFNDPRAWGLLAIAGLILLVPLLKAVELTLEELALVGLGFGLAVQHQRMLFVFGILAVPVLCRLVTTAWNHSRPRRSRNRILLNAVVISLAVWGMVQQFPGPRELSEQVNKGNPVKALNFIRHSGISGRMLNDYNYGGYLIWAAPERKVFADGRGDVYEWTGVLKDYISWSHLQDDPKVLLEKYRIDYCLLSRETPIWRVMTILPDWKSVYSDGMSVVFVRSTAHVTATPK